MIAAASRPDRPGVERLAEAEERDADGAHREQDDREQRILGAVAERRDDRADERSPAGGGSARRRPRRRARAAGDLVAPEQRVEGVVVEEGVPEGREDHERDQARGEHVRERPAQPSHRADATAPAPPSPAGPGATRMSDPPMLSLYRRHRPRTFDEVVGQEQIVRTLRNAVELGKVHHAYLFVGSRGTGKTSMAKLLASALNAEGGPRVDFAAEDPAVRRDRGGHVARRRRDGRRVEQLGRRHPRAAPEHRARARLAAGAASTSSTKRTCSPGGLERVPEDARGAAASRRLRARYHRGPQGSGDDHRPLPPLRLPAPDARSDRERRDAGSPTSSRSSSPRRRPR